MKQLSLTTQGLSPQALLSGRSAGGLSVTGVWQHTAEVALCCQERELSSEGDDREGRRAGASPQVGDPINVT